METIVVAEVSAHMHQGESLQKISSSPIPFCPNTHSRNQPVLQTEVVVFTFELAVLNGALKREFGSVPTSSDNVQCGKCRPQGLAIWRESKKILCSFIIIYFFGGSSLNSLCVSSRYRMA